jgi:hypothetical protein
VLFSGPTLRAGKIFMALTVIDNSQHLKLENYISSQGAEIYKNLKENKYPNWINKKEGPIEIWKYGPVPNLEGNEGEAYLINSNNPNLIIIFNFSTGNKEELSKDDYAIYQQILSAFKFTN